MKQLIILFIISIFCNSCSTREKVITEKFPDGSPKVVEIYEGKNDNKLMVKRIAYYDNKHKRVEGEYKDGKKDGKWTYWYENGRLWSEGYFKNDMSHGLRTTWHENGNKYIEGEFREGLRIGEWKFWSEEGELIKTKDYGYFEE